MHCDGEAQHSLACDGGPVTAAGRLRGKPLDRRCIRRERLAELVEKDAAGAPAMIRSSAVARGPRVLAQHEAGTASPVRQLTLGLLV